MSTTPSAIQAWAANEKNDLTAIATGLGNVATGVLALDAIITGLQASPGTLTPADQAALDDAQAVTKAILAQLAAISTAPPGAPVVVVPIPPPPPGAPARR